MMRESDRRLVQVVPTARQLKHQQLEFYGFIHFTVNTFTDREWGDGTESPEIFCPDQLDARQWARAAKDAGMRGLILTCKHHDGFCLWPSAYTRHSVAFSPYKEGKGDVVRELSDACREEGLAFGVYLSPWDRNHPAYGSGREYDDYFTGQLEELLTGYGEIFAVWFDGVCGEGPNGKRQIYDWERYYRVIRRLQPEACISVCGPDARWCGNEAGRGVSYRVPGNGGGLPADRGTGETAHQEAAGKDTGCQSGGGHVVSGRILTRMLLQSESPL